MDPVERRSIGSIFKRRVMNIQVDYSPQAHSAVRLAAGELERYLGRMLSQGGGQVRIRLETADRRNGPDQFQVRMTPTGGGITGNRPRSVLLGAYDYLRRLGCRFLGPGKECEIVPSAAPETLAMNYEETASFRHRGVCIEGADSRENILNFIDWLPKAGYNSFFLQFKSPRAFLARWYEHQRNPLRKPEPLTDADIRRYAEEFRQAVKERDLMLHGAGHGWTGEVLGYDAQSWDKSRPLEEGKRPLAALVNGKRDLYGGAPANTNLCLHNHEAVSAFAALAADYAGAHPGVDYLHVWLADEYNNVCECAGCQETILSDQYVELLNEIDRLLEEKGLETKIVFLLYQELLWPPIRARLVRPERFVLMFAPISRTFAASYQVEKQLPPLPPYRRNRIALPSGLGENLAFLRSWQALFHGDSFLYDYPLGRAHYGDLGYLHIARVIAGDVKQLRQLGLDGYVSCQELRAGLPNFLPNYVLGRVLWNEETDAEAVVREYFQAAYGEAWEEVLCYLSALSRRNACDYLNGKGERTDPHVARRMAEIQEACRKFSPVLEAHREDGRFWILLAYHQRYALALARALELLARGEREAGGRAWLALEEWICENEPDFQPFLDVYRVLEVTETYTGFPTKA